MSFLNQYYKGFYGYQYYRLSIKIGNFIYAIGALYDTNYVGSGLILKVDLSGAVIWEKTYGTQLQYDSIIKCENDDLLISGGNFVMRIDGEGEVIWNKSYSIVGGFQLAKLDGESYIIYTHPHLIKIDGSGNVITNKTVTSISGYAGISTSGSEIILASGMTFLIFDAELNPINQINLTPASNSGITQVALHTVNFRNGKIVMSGHVLMRSVYKTFVTEINYPLSQEPDRGSIVIKTFEDTGAKLYFNADYIYLSYSNSGEKVIKIDNDLNPIWAKRIGNEGNMSISHVDSDAILIVGFIGLLNLDIDSCLTSTIGLPPFGNASLDFSSDIPTTTGDAEILIDRLPLTVSPVISVIYEICPPVPKIPVLNAVNDTASVNGVTGGSGVLNVLHNDTINRNPINPSSVRVTPVTAGPLTINANGTLDVAPNTPAGTYNITYTICEVTNPANCDSAMVTVTVEVPWVSGFINEYRKESNGYEYYRDSIKIGNFIYAIGGLYDSVYIPDDVELPSTEYIHHSGLITKVDLSGAIIWEKTYNSGSNNSIRLNSIIKCENGDLLISGTEHNAGFVTDSGYVYGTEIHGHFVMRLTGEGEIIWNKSYLSTDTRHNSSPYLNTKLIKLNGENYVVYIPYPFIYADPNNNHLIKINGSGNIITNKNIVLNNSWTSPFNHLEISSNGSEILLAWEENGIEIHFFVFDSDLNLTNTFALAAPTNPEMRVLPINRLYVRTINFKNGKIAVSGSFASDPDKGFIAEINYPINQDSSTGTIIIKAFIPLGASNNDNCEIYSNTDYTYLSYRDSSSPYQVQKTKLIKLDNDLNQIWSRAIEIGGIRISHVGSNNVLLVGKYIGLLNSDINSCRTSDTILLSFSNVPLDFYSDIPTTIINAEITTGTLPLTISTVTSTVHEICPPVLEIPVINAINDVIGPINGFTGGSGILNVLNNDTLNGNPVTPSSVTVTPVTAGPITINANGTLDVAPNTPAETYTVTYTICEITNSTNCDSATVTVTVEVPEVGYFLNEYNKENYGSPSYKDSIKVRNSVYAIGVLTNSNNISLGIITKVNLSGTVLWEKTYGSSDNQNIRFDSILKCENGDLLISGSGNTQTGLFDYFVMRINGEGEIVWNKSYWPPSVAPRFTSKLVKLDGDNYIVYIISYGSDGSGDNLDIGSNHLIKIDGTGNILKNIRVSLTVNGWRSSATNYFAISTNGSEIILAGNNGSHENEIRFCVFDSNLNLINKFGLTPASNSEIISLYTHKINFENDKITASGLFSKLNTNIFKGFIAEINYPLNQEPNTGTIVIKTFEGLVDLYSNANYTYLSFVAMMNSGFVKKVIKLDNDLNQIWAKIIDLPPGALETKVRVDSFSNILITSTNIIGLLNLDMDSCRTSTIDLVPIGNETLDFYSNIPTTIVDVAITTGTIPLTISAVTSIVNEICPPINQIPIIDAINDAIGPVNGFTGASGVLNVLNNDTLNGNPVTPSSITVTPVTAGPLTINANGNLDVAPHTPAGTYTITYTICEIANPTNCDSATVTILVVAPPIAANNDFIRILNGNSGGANIANVLTNDTLNGSPVNPSFITLTPVTAGPLTINANGNLDIAPNTPVGTYNITYTICEITNPANCDAATVTVKVPEQFIQSVHLYLQAAGSQGLDSTRGNHLRWMLKGALEEHLPKGNYAIPSINFNKEDDFVRIYKAPYVERKITLHFNQAPGLVSDTRRSWTYAIDGYLFTVTFRNAQRYDSVRVTVDPNRDPLLFIRNYGNGLIEIESTTALSFAVTANFAVANINGLVKVELLSVEDNKASSPKHVSYRKSLNQGSINNKKILSENIKGIRFQSELGGIERMDLELYTIHIQESTWTAMGSYALSTDTNVVFARLEPESGAVHGRWLRYNDNAYTNIDNYKQKWNGSSVVADEQIVKTVEKYIELSNDVSNPLANETIVFDNIDNEPDPDYNTNQISNLNLLQIGALDYHVARMLGLGVLDMEPDSNNQKYMYLAEYITYADLEDGLGAREVQHLYCSLPTSIEDERLPLPIDLRAPVPGIYYGLDTEAPHLLTDEEGYSVDGRTRFLTLYHQELPEEIPNSAFFYTNREFVSSQQTEPVHAGIEHVVYEGDNPTTWEKPELPSDPDYFNIDTSVTANKRNETISIVVPEPTYPLFVHRQKQEGKHHYGSYGINWFSRATNSTVRWNSVTIFPVVNFLLPPTNSNALLIRKEAPLLLSSASEQVRLQNITDNDKTLIRLTFDYNHVQELKDYHKEINGTLVDGYVETDNSEEQFAESIEIFFRNEVPYTISGKIVSVEDVSEILAIVRTGVYTLISSGPGNQLIPSFPNNNFSHFTGSVLLIDDKQFIVDEAYNGTNGYPEFKVFKRNANGASNAFETTTPIEELELPEPGGIFVMVENMLLVDSWGSPAPIAFEVQIDPQVTAIHQEEILIVSPDALTVEKHVQKFRGIYHTATISKFMETVEEYEDDTDPILPRRHLGVYTIEFNGLNLNQHIQNSATNHAVEWMNGVVRLHTFESPDFARREFKVIRTQHIGTTQNLVVYVVDPDFDEDQPVYNRDNSIVEGTQLINYYPGYKVYLHKDEPSRLTEGFILPEEGEEEHYSIFGLRSKLTSLSLVSRISTPCLMFAQEINEPRQPEQPLGGLYATRPDFYGKATYSFSTKFERKPYSVQFNRTSDIQILTALYNATPVRDADGAIVTPSTIDFIVNDIFENGQDEYYVNRWENLLRFNYDYPAGDSINTDGLFKKYPDNQDGVRLPLPDSPEFIASINDFIIAHNDFYNNLPAPVDTITQINSLLQLIIPGVINRNDELRVVDFVKQVIYNSFVPLTEVPVIYKYVKTEAAGHAPLPKKQVVRDRNGNLLKPDDPDFDMAPMMVIKTPNPSGNPIIGPHEVQFTDFGLDGASNAKYFYAVREFNLQMKAGAYSPIAGPINLVNSSPPSAPEIVKIIPVLENRVLGILPGIQFEINSYPASQNIRKVSIYRAFNAVDSLSVRTMKEVKVIDLEVEEILESDKWVFKDDFSDLAFIPYGDPLFYRIVASRSIKYSQRDGSIVTDYAPSEASKQVITNITENYSPESPVLRYASEPVLPNGELRNVVLFCNKTVYKGKYHLYKMNAQGNWAEIKMILSNDEIIYFPLEDTSLNSNILFTKNSEGETIYHHFKVIAENTAGMFSSKEHILTVHNEALWEDVGGLG